MINQLRKIVGGPKNRTVCQGYDLDFTYISDTVVAMAYPASGLQQTYRNSIHEVSKYLSQKHSNYLIINVSNRKYDYEVFNKKVKDYVWQDHQAPTLDVLFQVANDSFLYLKENNGGNGVVCFHCNHGKGRTGTAIICLMVFCGFFSGVHEAIKFYNKRRFVGENYGVSQPCQLRYIEYFLLAHSQITTRRHTQKIKCYKISRIQFEGLAQNEYEINISKTRCQTPIIKKLQNSSKKIQLKKSLPIFSDIYIQVVQKGWVSNSVIARANINLNNCLFTNYKQFRWVMEGSSVRVSKSHSRKFNVYFYFQEFCQCQANQVEGCLCKEERKIEQAAWDKIIKICQKKQQLMLSSRDFCKLLFPSQCVEVEAELQKGKEQIILQKVKQQQKKEENRSSFSEQN